MEVKEFIRRRFPIDNNWSSGNCYFLALILKDRFNGAIYYDVIQGHFITKINGVFYDYDGIYSEEEGPYYIKWDEFGSYDCEQYKRVIRDCTK